MRTLTRYSFALVVLILMYAAGYAGTQESEARLSSALKLLGQAVDVAVTGPNYKAVAEAGDAAKEALKDKTLQTAWKVAAVKVAAKHTSPFLRAKTTEHIPVKRLRGILGEPDLSEHEDVSVGFGVEAHTIAVTWLEYDWCHFGVVDGTVMMLRADCKRLNQK